MDEQEYLYRKNKFLTEFILLYKSLPCLWNVKSKEYFMRERRAIAYKQLTKKLREVDGTADRHSVVRKINSLRSSLRKEARKVMAFAKKGREYKPKLWYYQLFSFVKGQSRRNYPHLDDVEEDVEETTEPNLKVEQENEVEFTEEDDDPLQPFTNTQETDADNAHEQEERSPSPDKENLKVFAQSMAVCQSIKASERKSKIFNFEVSTPPAPNVHTRSCGVLPTQEDEYDIYGKLVASKLRKIALQNNTQRVVAEKLINDALFLAEMGQLTRGHGDRLH